MPIQQAETFHCLTVTDYWNLEPAVRARVDSALNAVGYGPEKSVTHITAYPESGVAYLTFYKKDATGNFMVIDQHGQPVAGRLQSYEVDVDGVTHAMIRTHIDTDHVEVAWPTSGNWWEDEA